jgi:predicted nuclease of predicted toxin-antitoxin system
MRSMPQLFQSLVTFAETAHVKELPPEQITDILVWHHARHKADLFEKANKYKN